MSQSKVLNCKVSKSHFYVVKVMQCSLVFSENFTELEITGFTDYYIDSGKTLPYMAALPHINLSILIIWGQPNTFKFGLVFVSFMIIHYYS